MTTKSAPQESSSSRDVQVAEDGLVLVEIDDDDSEWKDKVDANSGDVYEVILEGKRAGDKKEDVGGKVEQVRT